MLISGVPLPIEILTKDPLLIHFITIVSMHNSYDI